MTLILIFHLFSLLVAPNVGPLNSKRNKQIVEEISKKANFSSS